MSPEDAEGDGEPEPDDPSSGPPPNPLDRPWVHPSELQLVRRRPRTRRSAEIRPREWGVGIASAVAAVLATVLVLVAFGALGGRHRSPLPPPVVTNPGDVVDYAVAERVGAVVAPSVVTVKVGGDDRPSRSARGWCSSRTASSRPPTSSTGPPKVEVSTTTGDDPPRARRRHRPADRPRVARGQRRRPPTGDARARRHRRASARRSWR